MLFERGSFSEIEVSPLSLPHLDKILGVEGRRSIEHRIDQSTVLRGTLVGVFDRFVDGAGAIDAAHAQLGRFTFLVEAEKFEGGEFGICHFFRASIRVPSLHPWTTAAVEGTGP